MKSLFLSGNDLGTRKVAKSITIFHCEHSPSCIKSEAKVKVEGEKESLSVKIRMLCAAEYWINLNYFTSLHRLWNPIINNK